MLEGFEYLGNWPLNKKKTLEVVAHLIIHILIDSIILAIDINKLISS